MLHEALAVWSVSNYLTSTVPSFKWSSDYFRKNHILQSKLWKSFFTFTKFMLVKLGLKKPQLPIPSASATSTNRAYPRLAGHPFSIKTEYDVVVVGSGYGGGVAASRMVRAGKSVCVLELGKEIWPGEYPHTFKDAMREYSLSGKILGKMIGIGKAAGLYHTVKGEGQDVFLGCGLGGTSLINAGVFLKPDERLLEAAEWPKEVRENPAGLEQYYVRAERMLQPTAFPTRYPKPRKLAVFERQADSLGLQDNFYRPPLTTTFCSSTNQAGIHMGESTGSGNECTGVNDGSKNSVLVTYLYDAWARGAELFCGINVRHVKKEDRGKGYKVFYEVSNGGGGKTKKWVRAREVVFLGAGALGTTEVLLRSQRYGLDTSPLLGQKFTGNGDMLAFAYNCKHDIGSLGHEALGKMSSKSCGPTITACIDMRGSTHAKNVRDGYIIQDGAIPGALAPVIQSLLETQTTAIPSESSSTRGNLLARLKNWILGPYARGGSVNRTLVYLTMSHDENEGQMVLEDDAVVLRWSGIGSQKRSAHLDSVLLEMTENLGGKLVKAPCITVHPLGGAIMSDDGTGLGGVVNHRGQLLVGKGHEVYEGIICVDGSIIPTSLGVNPCATITALAERSCDLIAQERGWKTDHSSNGRLSPAKDPLVLVLPESTKTIRLNTIEDSIEGVRFEEVMRGHIHLGNHVSDFNDAEKVAREASSSAQLALTVDARRNRNGSYQGVPFGTFACGTLSHDPLMVTGGTVEFFTIDEEVADAVNIVYKVDLLSTDGARYGFHGYKRLNSAAAFSVSRTWGVTTTLYTTITGYDGVVVGRGILHLSLHDFFSELQSLRSRTTIGGMSNMQAQARFLKFFATNIASYMFSPFRRLQYPTPSTGKSGYFEKAIPTVTMLTADDGVRFPIKLWQPPSGTQEKHTPIVFIPGASVDDQMFSLPTVPTNTIDYFTSLGYRCYVPILRFGVGEEARKGDTVYDARLDVRAAMQYVREREQERKIYAVVHCLGSIATGIALLKGNVEASWLKGMTCSQVFTNLLFSPDNDFKARHPILIKAYETLAGSWFPCHSSSSSPWVQFLLDQILRFYPVGTRSEICNSAVCHRCDVPFGRCWTHANLNHATHEHLGHWFDGIHTNFLSHLSNMGAMPPYHVRSNRPVFEDLLTQTNLERLKGLSICLLSGAENAVWSQQSTKSSYDLLRECFPEVKYERVVVKGYGHLDCWMGKHAHVDIFPRVARHLAVCEEAEEGCETTVIGKGYEEDGYVDVAAEGYNSRVSDLLYGMHDILLAYSKPTMDRFRSQLADLLKRTVSSSPHLLERKGWEGNFVRNSMGEMAATAVLLGKGNSGDLVRVVTDITLALVDGWSMDQLDEVHFWRLPDEEKELNLVGVVALTKMFIVEWSNEFDYQMYHDLPVNLKFA